MNLDYSYGFVAVLFHALRVLSLSELRGGGEVYTQIHRIYSTLFAQQLFQLKVYTGCCRQEVGSARNPHNLTLTWVWKLE